MIRVAEQYAGSDTGRQRRANEDSHLARAPLFVVADGMGGAQAGEVASRVAVDAFRAGVGHPSDPERALMEQVQSANARIHELSHDNAEHAGMGTTLTVVYVGEQDISIAHVGDSRAYCLRDGELVRLTDDHSLVDELIRQGRLTPEEAEEHPQRSIITRALGPEEAVEVDTRSYRARGGDVYLVCSDGLTSMVSEQQILEVMRSHAGLADAGQALISAANEAGGRDNITVVLLRLEEVSIGGGGAGSQERDGSDTLTDMRAIEQPPQAMGDGDGHAHPAANTLTAAPPAPVARRLPRMPGAGAAAAKPRRRRRRRAGRMAAGLVVLAVLAVLGAGAYLADQSVYFIGTNQRGLVTIFRGVPWELPGGLHLYSTDYVSGVSASTLSGARRHSLLDHSLHSEKHVAELVRQLELGQLSE